MTLGQAIGGGAGAIGGFLLGGPSGAILGFQIGMGIGSFIDPPSAEEPNQSLQQQDLQFNTFARNLPIPIVYGTCRVAGNIIWIGNTFTEVVERESTEGGKGAPEPPKTREVWYHADFAMALSEGEIAGVDQVKVDDEDFTDTEGLNYTVYDGDAAQVADSLVVQALGANAPAFRNTGYLRFTGRLGRANRVPNVTAILRGLVLTGDTFTDTFSRSNAGSLGPDWAEHGALSGAWSVASNQARTEGIALPNWARIGVVASAFNPAKNMRVSVRPRSPSSGGGGAGFVGVEARVQSLTQEAYGLFMVPGAAGNPEQHLLHLVRFTAANSYVFLAGSVAAPFKPGNILTLVVSESMISAEVNGITVIPPKSDGTIQAAGFAGMISQTATRYLDDFMAGIVALPRSYAATFTDDFNRGDATDLGSRWMPLQNPNFFNEWEIRNAEAFISQGFRGREWLVPGAVNLDPDMTASVRLVDLALISNPAASGQLIGRGVEVRGQNSSQAGYIGTIDRVASAGLAISSQGQRVQIGLATAGFAFTVLGSAFVQPGVVSSGDRFGLEAIGSTLRLFVNSTPVLTVLDMTIQSAGTAGLFSDAAGAQGDPARLDDFQVHANGNLGHTGAETSVFATGNPAIEVKDLLTNARYGLGLSLARIDRPSFEVGGAYCDALVRAPDGTLEKRFVLDIVLDQSRPIPDHLRDMLATFRGFLVWSSGKVKLRIEQAEAISQPFDMGTIVADSLQWRRQSYRDRPNVIRVEYINAADDHRHDFVEAFDDWDIDTTGERRERIVRLQGIKRSSQAQRMAQFYLDQAIHAVHACTFRVGIAALKAEVGDVVEISHDVPAWVAKKFRILQIEEAENDELTLSCLEYNAAIYHDEANAVQPSLAQPLNAAALPYHVGRFTAYKRRNEDTMELAFTRLRSADNFAGALMYRRRGTGGDFVQLDGTALAVAPTAYLDSEVRSIAKTATGSPAGAIGANSFFDPFSRTSQASLGADWAELGPADYRVQSHRLWRAEEYVRVARMNSPHAYWRLREGSGGASADDLGRAAGSYFNTPSLGQVGALIDDGDAAALFVGSAHQRTAPSSWLTIGSKDFSMETWLAFTQTSFGVPWVVRDEGVPTNPAIQGLFTVNIFTALLSAGIGSGWIEWASWAVGSAATRLRIQSWHASGSYHHAVAVYKVASNHAELWVNGTLADSRTQFASSPIDVKSQFSSMVGANIFGVGSSGQFFEGKADEVALYPFALTQSQVVAHYRAGLGSGTFDTPSGPTSSVVARTSAHSLVTDPEVTAKMADSRLVGFGPRIGLAARWQTAGDYGQFYYLEYMTRTLSHAVREIGLYRVTSGPVTNLLSASFVTSGTYFTLPDSPTTFALKVTSFTLEGKLNGAVIVSAVDSTIQGAGEAGVVRMAGIERYPDVVHPNSPLGYWRLAEGSGSLVASEQLGQFPGSYFGTVSLGQVGALLGDRDTAGLFTNSGAAMKTIASSRLIVGSADFSLEAWLRFSASSLSLAVIAGSNVFSGTLRGIQGAFAVNRTPAFVDFETWANPDGGTHAVSIDSLNNNSWHHCVGVYHVNSNYTELFVDGLFQSSRYQGNSYTVLVHTAFWLTAGANLDLAFSFPGAVDEVAYYPSALSSARVVAHYRAGIGSGDFARTQGERWDDLTWIASGEASVNSPILVRALPEGWAARLFSPTSALLTGALASLGDASMVLSVGGGVQPTSGFLQVFQDQSFAAWAPDGRLPSSGFADFRGGDVYLYDRDLGFVTATQTFLPIYNAKGGFANIGSVRLRAEEMGYSTFTDSRLEGVTRGAAGTPATSHSNLLSLGAFVVTTGAVGSQTLLDLTAAAANPLSNMPFFADNSSYVYLGGPSRFSRMGMFLERNASSVVSMAYEYSTGDGTWASLVLSGFIGPTDLTSGLRQSGPIFVEPAGDWNPTNRVASGGASIGDASSRYYLRMLRTSSLLATPPRELEILLDGDLLVAGRKENAYLYAPTVQDSMQALFFKAIAVGVQGQMAEGTKAPVTHVWSA